MDTNVLSDARKKDATALRAWISNQPRLDLAISVITILELERGILSVERRDPVAGRHLRLWLDDQVMPAFEEAIVPVDKDVARQAARLHIPDPMPEMDALIAATAMTHNLTLVTRNVKDFRRTNLPILDPNVPY
ncbi:putative nucleic acid-binding protein [Trueperella bonasi]|uniref:Nucleic acid-binding protein n=1 Tax=Trueperella bonasi TaxID=312286 RepID=A0ABT9NED4_9ACTO|nr:type II toxin-antitoxin system VapC family toxin [Trueperella bonasi]MDP9805748.1 putative nucleic acid-binding protein [Trueperella bonasi]